MCTPITISLYDTFNNAAYIDDFSPLFLPMCFACKGRGTLHMSPGALLTDPSIVLYCRDPSEDTSHQSPHSPCSITNAHATLSPFSLEEVDALMYICTCSGTSGAPCLISCNESIGQLRNTNRFRQERISTSPKTQRPITC